MPIQGYERFMRMNTLCQTNVPSRILEAIEAIKDDDQKVKEYGIQLGANMSNELRLYGFRGLHFYTLNLEKAVSGILGLLDKENVDDELKERASLAL